MGDVVRTIVELVGAVTSALAQHHGIGQSGGSGGDMHGGTTSKVETAHLIGPAVRVPGPACDGVVDDRSPDEHEDDAGQHATTFGDSTGGERNGDGREHTLVDGEQEVRNAARANRRLGEHVFEAKVGKVSDVRTGSVREGQRIPPEEPLEGGDGCGHDRQPDQRQG
jgi:hypothetical protein